MTYILKCTRCNLGKYAYNFSQDLLRGVCHGCLTDEEIIDYTQPEITKLMLGISVEDKVAILKACYKDHKIKQSEQNHGIS